MERVKKEKRIKAEALQPVKVAMFQMKNETLKDRE